MIPIIIYSSGSVPAQKLLFQYTNSTSEADLRPLLTDYFDTVNAGPKTEKASYEKIAATRKEDVSKWLFLSDNVKEVKAAKEAGMQSYVVVRKGNPPLSADEKEGQTVIESFDDIKIPSQTPKARGRGRPKKREGGVVDGAREVKKAKVLAQGTRQGLRSRG